MKAQPRQSPPRDDTVTAAVRRHGASKDAVLPILQTTQELNGGHLPRPVLAATAAALALPEAQVQGLATFYSMLSTKPRAGTVVRLCDGPVCWLRGAPALRAAIEAASAGQPITLERTSCLGLCDCAPAALVGARPLGPVRVDAATNLANATPINVPTYAQPRPGETRAAMARIGQFDPDSFAAALAAGAYGALAKALEGDPARLLTEIERAGLRGYGGAGFPVAHKWRVVARASHPTKYVVCNADESEPGTFKDRVLLDGDPHLVLEGMALAALATGAREGFVYVRGEYAWIADRLEKAASQATARGWLGDRIRGSDFSFHVHVHRGAGAYVCGEETALLESLEGKRGEPRFRPPVVAERGLHGCPTVVNNVETFCYVPIILARGADWFRSFGTPTSPGLKLYCVSGCVRQPGVFEAPLGLRPRQVIEEFGGGLASGGPLKAALAGGAAGEFIPPALLEVPMDFASVRQGVPLGAGGLIVLDAETSIPEMLANVLHFFEVESCGKCTPCREGTREARATCERLASGTGGLADVESLRRLGRMLDLTSLCGLGRSVSWPIASALRHFEAEFHQANASR